MAIVKSKPTSTSKVETSIPTVSREAPSSNFTELVPFSRIEGLLKYVEGYPWSVNYYGIIRADGNTVEHFDPTTPNLIQSYYKVNQLVLNVDSPLSSSYDQNTGITTITGSAIAPLGLKPNVGDLFLANVDSGEDAYFHVTSVERKQFTKNTLYSVSYSLHMYNSDDPTFGITLNERVNTEYYFNKDTDYFNRDMLIKPSVKEAIDILKNFMGSSQDYYFKVFPQERTGSILIPGLNDSIYDPLLVKFVSKIVSYDRLGSSRVYNHSNVDPYMDQPSIWDLLIQRSLSMLPVSNKLYSFVRPTSLKGSARLGTMGHAGVDYVLYPKSAFTNTKVGGSNPTELLNDLSLAVTDDNHFINSSFMVETKNNDNVYSRPLLPVMFKDSFYLVSEGFYNYLDDKAHFDEISYIELIMYKFMSGDAIVREDLAMVVKDYVKWSVLHQLYYLPVMWLIVKTQLSGSKV